MYSVSKRMEIAAAHQLHLPYKSKCSDVHGHNWVITVKVSSPELNESGMVVDFTHLKRAVHDKLDHGVVNDWVDQPTAENMAKWIADEVAGLPGMVAWDSIEVSVQESEGNVACFTK